MTGAVALTFPSLAPGKSKKSPPNIVFIICDQMRADTVNCFGHRNTRTPNLDKMAAEGALFENYFSNSPVCAPSRVTLFTGQYPHQHGQRTNKSGKFISHLETSMLGYFRKRGYRIGWIGKNHAYTKECLNKMDVWIDRGREPFRAYSKYVPPYWHSDTLWPEEKCHPRMTTNDSIKFIQEADRDQPFFLHISYFDPHPPYMAPSEYTSRYNSEDMKIPPYVAPEKLGPRLTEHVKALHFDKIKDSDITETMRYYYAAVEWGVDEQVGRVLKALKNKGILDNTIVVFTSDHGDFMGEHRMVRKGMFLYDALLHVPFIWYAPGLVQKGLRTDTPAQGVDLFPTLADLTGGNIPENVSGRSLKKVLQGQEKNNDDTVVIASAGYSDLPPDYFDDPEKPFDPDNKVPFHTRVEKLTWKDEKRTIMARTKEWKLIKSDSRPTELYRMAGGWIEKENVAEKPEFQAIRKNLEAKLKKSWKW